MLNPPAEMWKGLSDIPLVILTVIFAVLLEKKRNRSSDWAKLMLLAAFSAAGGVGAHVFRIREPWISIFWCAEYLLLYELIRRSTGLLIRAVSERKIPEKNWVPISEAVLFITACVIRFVLPGKDIYLLVLFAALMLLRFSVILTKTKKIPAELKAIPCVIIPVVLCQAVAEKYPFAVVIEHLLLAVGLYFVYRLGSREEAEK